MVFVNWVIAAKAGLDLAVALALLLSGKLPQGVMFGTFVLVDMATLWVSNAS
jgi:hypothetical protein